MVKKQATRKRGRSLNAKRKKRLSFKQGGSKFTSGADTCVFIPQVACDSRHPTPEELRGPEYISRIVPSTSSDVRTEEFINANFAPYVAKGWISVLRHSCAPRFVYRNMKLESEKVRGPPCSRITEYSQNNYTNMITKFYNRGDYGEYSTKKQFTIEEHLDNLRTAMNAAVALVPDAGPWVIHTDCHHGNIFVDKTNGVVTTGLADWGRCILLPEIQRQESSRAAIDSLMKLMSALLKTRLVSFTDWIANDLWKYPQHSRSILKAAQRDLEYLNSPAYRPADAFTNLKGLRGWTVYAILNALRNAHTNPLRVDISPLLSTTSQKDLQETLNRLLGKEDYINVVEIPAAAPLPARTSSSVSLSENPLVPVPLPKPISVVKPQAEYIDELRHLVEKLEAISEQKKRLKEANAARNRANAARIKANEARARANYIGKLLDDANAGLESTEPIETPPRTNPRPLS